MILLMHINQTAREGISFNLIHTPTSCMISPSASGSLQARTKRWQLTNLSILEPFWLISLSGSTYITKRMLPCQTVSTWRLWDISSTSRCFKFFIKNIRASLQNIDFRRLKTLSCGKYRTMATANSRLKWDTIASLEKFLQWVPLDFNIVHGKVVHTTVKDSRSFQCLTPSSTPCRGD